LQDDSLKKSLELKKNILAALPCIAVIVFAAVFHYDYIRDYYEDVLSKSGLEYVDSEKELKKENQRAAENEKEYQKLLQAEEEKNNPADPNSDETQDHQNSTESSVKLRSSMLCRLFYWMPKIIGCFMRRTGMINVNGKHHQDYDLYLSP
jgi:hypothetical protein